MNIDQFTEVIAACRFCFMCRHLSAVGQAECREADTPRVRALMADNIRKHPELLGDPDFQDAVYRSDLSGSNSYHCRMLHGGKDGFDELALQFALRRDIAESGFAPEAVRKLADEFEASAGWEVSPGSSGVLYFEDRCTAETPEIGRSFAKVAAAAGVEYRVVKGGCIGKVLRILGFQDRSRKAAAKFADFINGLGAELLVVSNPAAYNALASDYREYGIDLKVKVMHTSEYMASLGVKFRKAARKVSLLDSDFLKIYTPDAPWPADFLKLLQAENIPFGTNQEESYSAGEAAVVLPRLYPRTAAALASKVAAVPCGEQVLTVSPFTRKALQNAGMQILSLEEFAAEHLL